MKIIAKSLSLVTALALSAAATSAFADSASPNQGGPAQQKPLAKDILQMRRLVRCLPQPLLRF
jgi:hypothetical protein